MKNPFSKTSREEREAEKGIQRDDDGKPVVCDCPDGQSGPCDGRGWCRR
jgi:hypothetical protein